MNEANDGSEDKPWWRRHKSAIFDKSVIIFEQREVPAKEWDLPWESHDGTLGHRQIWVVGRKTVIRGIPVTRVSMAGR